MHIEFRRSDGALLGEMALLHVSFDSRAELQTYCREALLSLYVCDGHTIWLRPKFFSVAVEEVRVLDDQGSEVVSYSISDFISEAGHSLVLVGPRGEYRLGPLERAPDQMTPRPPYH